MNWKDSLGICDWSLPTFQLCFTPMAVAGKLFGFIVSRRRNRSRPAKAKAIIDLPVIIHGLYNKHRQAQRTLHPWLGVGMIIFLRDNNPVGGALPCRRDRPSLSLTLLPLWIFYKSWNNVPVIHRPWLAQYNYPQGFVYPEKRLHI